jgi:hypothetical protein
MKQLPFSMQKPNATATLPAARVPRAVIFALMTLAATTALQAHPGHGFADQGIAHSVTSPYHLAMLTGAGLALFWGSRLMRRPAIARRMRWVGVVAIAGAGILWGMGV